ncbi:MAG: hypothetical protein HDT23_08855 [Ruminococcus sp.]|nr:hypothetical protein [Ruminococcus sp.]
MKKSIKTASNIISLVSVFGLSACGNTTTSEIISSEIEITCPFADYTFSPVRVTSPAYAPYLLEVEEQTASQLYDAFVNASWELIPSDTTYPDGESFHMFVYNNGQPFTLVFYGDYTVEYEYENTTERYKIDDTIYKMAHDTANPANLGDIVDTLIWCESEFLTNEKVWNEHE